jgi:hypothetical protein
MSQHSETPVHTTRIINELLDVIKSYECICDKILKKGSLSVRDEIEYNNAITIIKQCDNELRDLGYYDE